LTAVIDTAFYSRAFSRKSDRLKLKIVYKG